MTTDARSPQSASGVGLASDYEVQLLRRRQWSVLLGVFCGCLVLGLAYVWLRPPVYQSQAILHFSFPQPLGQAYQSVSDEQVAIHARRLLSNRVLLRVQEVLAADYALTFSTEELAEMFAAEPLITSRIITVTATDSEPDALMPALTVWVEVYLAQRETEQNDDISREIERTDQKVDALEARSIAKREELSVFSANNQIVSLERDENRALSTIKGLGKSLDNAREGLATAEARLSVIRDAIEAGAVVIRPQDQAGINAIENSVSRLRAKLQQFAERYTEAYMELDPAIKSVRRNFDSATERLEHRRKESRSQYLSETEQDVAAARQRVVDLEQQLTVLEAEAQVFNSRLAEYRSLAQELADLEAQTQELKQQRVQLEVQRPFEARIDLLEAPYLPEYSIGPAYWRDSGITALVSALVAFLALFVYTAIQGRRSGGVIFAPFSVHPHPQSRGALGSTTAEAVDGSVSQRLELQASSRLSDGELRSLYTAANSDGKRAIGLLLCGVAPLELEGLEMGDVDLTGNSVAISGRFARQLPLSSELAEQLQEYVSHIGWESSLWQKPGGLLTLADLSVLVHQAALDARLDNPADVSLELVRYSYLAYLVSQGCRLSELERLAGYLAPAELASLRTHADSLKTQSLGVIETRFPLF